MSLERYRHPILFYGLSLVLPASFWILAGQLSWLPNPDNFTKLVSGILGLLGLSSPALVAAVLFLRDPVLAKDLRSRIFNFTSFKTRYLVLSLGLMLASLLLAISISLIFGYSPNQFQIGKGFSFSAGIYPTWFILLLAPLVEELGWHTYGTDTLRRSFNLFITTIIFSFYWVVWHMPLALIKGYYQQELVSDGWIYSLNFAVSIFAFVILMNWLYIRTNRNLVLTIIFHISASFFNELFPVHPDSKLIQTAILLLISAVVLVKERQLFFSFNWSNEENPKPDSGQKPVLHSGNDPS